MDSEFGQTCDLCQTFYPYEKRDKWTGPGFSLHIPQTEVVMALVISNGKEVDICEKCYFEDPSISIRFPDLEKELVAGFNLRDDAINLRAVMRNWVKKRPTESGFFSALSAYFFRVGKKKWSKLASQKARAIYKESQSQDERSSDIK